MTDIKVRNELPAMSTLLPMLLDTSVTARSRGVLLSMADLPVPWRGNRNQLARLCCPELGRHAFLYVMRELVQVDYLTVTPSNHTPSGQLWTLHAPTVLPPTRQIRSQPGVGLKAPRTVLR